MQLDTLVMPNILKSLTGGTKGMQDLQPNDQIKDSCSVDSTDKRVRNSRKSKSSLVSYSSK